VTIRDLEVENEHIYSAPKQQVFEDRKMAIFLKSLSLPFRLVIKVLLFVAALGQTMQDAEYDSTCVRVHAPCPAEAEDDVDPSSFPSDFYHMD